MARKLAWGLEPSQGRLYKAQPCINAHPMCCVRLRMSHMLDWGGRPRFFHDLRPAPSARLAKDIAFPGVGSAIALIFTRMSGCGIGGIVRQDCASNGRFRRLCRAGLGSHVGRSMPAHTTTCSSFVCARPADLRPCHSAWLYHLVHVCSSFVLFLRPYLVRHTTNEDLWLMIDSKARIAV